MELFGGFMIMSVLLGFFFAAVWLSLPILILGLRRRIEESAATLERLEARMLSLEQKIVHHPASADEPVAGLDTLSGGVDGTVGR